MTAARRWQDLTTTDFAALDRETTVAVLPVGAVEQHGPHLPLITDALIAEEMARRGAERAPSVPSLLLPTLSVGKSNEHVDYAGTLTLSAETLGRTWLEVGESVARAGLRKLLFVNAHGGQPQVMEIIARELRVRHAMMCVTSSWWAMGLPDGLVPEAERRHGIHGGMIETSVMLHLAAGLVRMEEARDFRPIMADLEGRHERLTHIGAIGIGWQAQDIHPEGVAGDAAAATAEIGAAIVDHATAGYATLIGEISAYPLDLLKHR